MAQEFKNLIHIFKKAFILLIIISGGFYIYYVVVPEKQFTEKIAEFEKAFREENKAKLYTLISKNSRWLDSIDEVNHIKKEFEKFGTASEIRNVSYVPTYVTENDSFDRIWGEVRKIARIDGKYRYFPSIMLVKEKDEWLIQQFFFPDNLDY